MKKILSIFIFSISCFFSLAQNNNQNTHNFKVFGLVEKELIVDWKMINKFNQQNIGELNITNHSGEFRRSYLNLKGILIKDILEEVNIKSNSPKLLSEYYLVARASDGYQVVFSWNEIFNHETGNQIFLVVEANGKPMIDSDESILIVATKDFRTGRRHIKNLQSLEIKRI